MVNDDSSHGYEPLPEDDRDEPLLKYYGDEWQQEYGRDEAILEYYGYKRLPECQVGASTSNTSFFSRLAKVAKRAGDAVFLPEISERGKNLYESVNADREQVKPLLGGREGAKPITIYDLQKPENGIGGRPRRFQTFTQKGKQIISESTSYLGNSYLSEKELERDVDMPAGFKEGAGAQESFSGDEYAGDPGLAWWDRAQRHEEAQQDLERRRKAMQAIREAKQRLTKPGPGLDGQHRGNVR
jgi:hypothetical protein